MITFLLVLIIIGIILGFVPMDATIKKIVIAIILIIAVIILFQYLFGIGGGSFTLPRIGRY